VGPLGGGGNREEKGKDGEEKKERNGREEKYPTHKYISGYGLSALWRLRLAVTALRTSMKLPYTGPG